MKLPVIRAFSDTYSELFANFGNIVKVAWLPFLVIAFIFGWELFEVVKVLQMPVPSDATDQQVTALVIDRLQFAMRWSYLIGAGVFILIAIVTTGILRGLIRREWPSIPFYIGSGLDDLRVLGVSFLARVVVYAITLVAAVILVIALMLSSAAQNSAVTGWVMFIGMFGIYIAAIWASLRLWLVAPTAIAERRLAFDVAWTLTSGNAWRLFAFAILVFLPIYFLFSGLIASLVLPLAPEIQAESARLKLDPNAPPSAQLGTSVLGALVILGLGYIVMSALTTFLTIVGSGVAYRLMTEED